MQVIIGRMKYLLALSGVVIAERALAQTSGGSTPQAPIQILQTARQNAATNGVKVDPTTVATYGNNLGLITIVAFAGLGLIAAGWSSYKLWQNVHDGEQARGSNTGYVMGVVIGSLVTVTAAIVGLVTNVFITG